MATNIHTQADSNRDDARQRAKDLAKKAKEAGQNIHEYVQSTGGGSNPNQPAPSGPSGSGSSPGPAVGSGAGPGGQYGMNKGGLMKKKKKK